MSIKTPSQHDNDAHGIDRRGDERLTANLLARADAVRDVVDVAAAKPDVTGADRKFLAFAAKARKLAYEFGTTPDKAEPIFRAIIGGYGQGHADACDACRIINAGGYTVPANVARPDDAYQHTETEGAMP